MPHGRWQAPGKPPEQKTSRKRTQWQMPLDVGDVDIAYRDPLTEEAELFERLMQEFARNDEEPAEKRRPAVWTLPSDLTVSPC